jgi:hypothetical protein
MHAYGSFKIKLLSFFTSLISHSPKHYWIFKSMVQNYSRKSAVVIMKIENLLVTARPVMTEDS